MLLHLSFPLMMLTQASEWSTGLNTKSMKSRGKQLQRSERRMQAYSKKPTGSSACGEASPKLRLAIRSGTVFTFMFSILPMTGHNLNSDKELPHGLAPNFIAPFSGQLSTEAVTASLATLPKAFDELRTKLRSIDSVRASGLLPTFEGGPLDDAVRNGVWHAELQIPMPTAGGLAGSRGVKQEWPDGNASQKPGPTRTNTRAGNGFTCLPGVVANL